MDELVVASSSNNLLHKVGGISSGGVAFSGNSNNEFLRLSSSSSSSTGIISSVAVPSTSTSTSVGTIEVGGGTQNHLEDEGTVLDSGIVPFFDTSDGSQIIFKGILDSNGSVIIDPSFLMSGLTFDGLRDGNFSFASFNSGHQQQHNSSTVTRSSEQEISDSLIALPSAEIGVQSTKFGEHQSGVVLDKTNYSNSVPSSNLENQNEAGPSCQNSFQVRRNLPIRVAEDVEPPIRKGPHVCSECGKSFPNWANLKRHKAEHLDEKSFRCSLCPMSYNYESNWTLHMMLHDAEANGSLECKMCPAKFSRMASLRSHVRVHEKEENLVCAECGDEFATEARLQNHLDEHNTSNTKSLFYRCKLCGKSFNQSALLKDHSKEHAAVRNQLKVLHPRRRKPAQPKTATTSFNMQQSEPPTSTKIFQSLSKAKQRKDLKKKLHCSVCSKRFEKPSQLSRHMRIHTGEKPFVCPHCQRSFNQKCTLESHILSMHDKLKPFVCHICNSSFSQRGNLKAHVLKVHVPPGNDVKYFKCEECPCVYKRIATLNAHIAKVHTKPNNQTLNTTHNETNSEEVVDKDQSETADLEPLVNSLPNTASEVLQGIPNDHEKHESAVSKTVTSGISSAENCEKPNEYANISLTRMLQEESENEDSQEDTTEVNIMHESGGSSKQMQVKVRKILGEKWHLCPFDTCSKSFKKPSDLIRHIRVHTQEKPFTCDKCGKSFAVKSTLRTHSKTHSDTKDWECRICRKQFSVLNSLKVHERLHTGAKPFHCSQCSKCFRTSSQRRTHMRAHARNSQGLMGGRRVKLLRIGENQPIQKVDLPDPLRITSDGDLVPVPNRTSGSMLKVTTDMTEKGSAATSEWTKSRPYRCTQCPSAFKKSSHLKQHLRSHTGDRPYKCFQCYRNFISSGVLKNHIKTHEGVRAHKCAECQLTFTTNGSLKRHMISVHSELRSFVCPNCHKTFKTSVQCRKHIKTHRNELIQLLAKKDSIATGHSASTISVNTSSIRNPIPEISDSCVSLSVPLPSNLEVGQHQAENSEDNFISGDVEPSADILQNRAEVSIFHHQTTPGDDPNRMNQSSVPTVPDNDQNTESLQIHEINELINSGPDLSAVASQDVANQYSLQPPEAAQHQISISLADGHSYDGPIFTLQNGSINLAGTMSHILPTPSHVVSSCPSTSVLNVPECSETHDTELEYVSEQNVCEASLNQMCDQTNEARLQSKFDEENISAININVISVQGEPNLELDSGNIVTIFTDDSVQDKGKMNVCSQCGRGFKKRSDLLRHFRIHTGEKPFKCHICGKAFRVKSTRESHLRTHEGGKPVSCNICHNMFSTKSSLNVHLRLHTGSKPYKCPHCDKHFRTSGHRKAHLQWHIRAEKEGNKDGTQEPRRTQNHSLLPPVQTITGKSSKNTTALNQPRVKQENQSTVDETLITDVLIDQSSVLNSGNGTSICYLTTGGDGSAMLTETSDPMQIVGSLQLTVDSGLPNVQITGLDLNAIQLSDEFLQSLGNVIFMTQSHQSNSISSQNDSLSGSMMGQSISVLTGKDLNIGSTAMEGNHSVAGFGDLESVQTSSNELVHGFINSPLLSSVIIDHKNQNNTSESNTSNNKQCSVCGKLFTKPSLLKRHMTMHTGEKPFKCKECGCAFNQKNSLDAHMFTHGDQDERPFACSLCPFRTVLKTALKKHCLRAHKDTWNDTMISASKSLSVPVST